MRYAVASQRSAFLGSKNAINGSRSTAAATRPDRRRVVEVRSDNCLVVNTKGGGHAFIGFHLARALLSNGHSVTLMNDGQEESLTGKNPFAQYGQLSAAGASVVWGDPTNPSTYPSGPFDVVYDNNGKSLDVCQPLIDAFKGNVSHYVFVSSAGAYNANSIEPMHVEGDPRKPSAGHSEVEGYLKESGAPYTVFQPLYIYGPYTAKDCEHWFIDRVIRDRPVPIPAPGIQMTSLSHVEDIASMLATVPGNPAAVILSPATFFFNHGQASIPGIVKAVADTLGKEPKIVYYDPTELGLKKGEGFPFRTVHFFASSDKAKMELGWKPKHSFMKDVKELVAEYIANGRTNRQIDFSVDDKILSAVATTV